ncbi:MAG: hypothetical protein AAGA15_12070 [Pseudomonadota bacterium]
MRLAAALTLALAASPALSADLSLIVDRSERGVEMFVKFPTGSTEALLAPFPAGFLASEGVVDIAPFRAGTADHGDDLWRGVETRIGGETAFVEAMSMMVHPDSLPVDFNDPVDGWIAMAVCNVVGDDTLFGVDVLSTYAGYIAWEVAGHDRVEIAFPSTMEIEVTEFLEGREIHHAELTVGPDKPLTLDPVTRWERWRLW